MNPDEYTKLARVETEHWFYAGKREIVRYWLERARGVSASDLLVDVGAGTGIFAAEMSPHCRVLAIDDHEESLRLARQKLGDDRIKQGSCTTIPLPEASADLLTALDVIEHVENDAQALEEFSRVLRPGGIVVITVPALPSLWSDWDVVLHHYRRYTRSSFLRLIPQDKFEVMLLNYTNVVALPLIYLIRKWRAAKPRFGLKAGQRSEDELPPPWINAMLKWTFVRLACQGAVRFPAGVSLLAVLRKR